MGKPNVLITGTPGVGKTSISSKIAELKGYEHINVSKVVIDNKLYSEYDKAKDTYVIDEDKLIDYLEPIMEKGGKIIDHHSVDLYPREWFGLCVVLRVGTEQHYDRLKKRGYSDKKREENMEAEIFGMLEEEAEEYFEDTSTKVLSLQNNTQEEFKKNVEEICQEIDALSREGE